MQTVRRRRALFIVGRMSCYTFIKGDEMKDKEGIFENETDNVSTGINDHQIDCPLIWRDEEEETQKGAKG